MSHEADVRARSSHQGHRHICQLCGIEYSDEAYLGLHIRSIHEVGHGWQVCGKVFTQAAHLTRHMASVHRGGKPYHCTQCGKGYRDNSQLYQHTQEVHNGGNTLRKGDC